MRAPYHYLFALGLCLGLLACGGGGGASSGGTTPVSLSITDASPRTAAPGASLTVTGTAFNTVTQVSLGGVVATFTRISDTSLTLIVPASSSTGAIQLSAPGTVLTSSFDITVTAPTVSSLNPASIPPGQSLTINGGFLDQVTSVRLGTVTLPISTQSASQLVVTVPADALSGALVLETASGLQRTSSVTLVVLTPLAVGSLSPQAGNAGTTVTLQGAGLDRITQVEVGGRVAPIVSQQNSQLILTIPTGAALGASSLTLSAADSSLTTIQSFRVAPTMVVTSINPAFGNPGDTITVNGSGLSEVEGVSLAGRSQTILSGGSDTGLRFSVAAGSTSGELRLSSASQASVSAGNFTVGSSPQITISRIDFVQTYAQVAAAQYQRLVPGKPLVVRAYVRASAGSSVSNPGITLVVRNGSTVLTSLPMTGPTVLPTAEAPYNLAQTYNATLIASQVISGLNVTVELAPATGVASLSATPQMAGATNMKLTLVPIKTGTGVGAPTGALPSSATVRSALRRTLPLADSAIELSTRGVFTTGVVSGAPVSGDDWGAVLGALDDLRQAEAPNRHYFGFVPNDNNTQTAGLAYVNGAGFTRSDTGIGLDTSYFDWENTFIHEMGHNLSREHAPCGISSNDFDQSYPYAGGVLGGAPLYDINAVYQASYLNSVSGAPGNLEDPDGKKDIMSYCSNADWFSDYNYHAMQSHLLSNTYPRLINQAAESELLLLRGQIRGNTVQFRDPGAAFGVPRYDAGGSHTLRLTLADGQVLSYAVRPLRVADGPQDLLHFSLRLPHPGPLRKLEMLRGEQLLSQPASTAAKRSGAATATARVDWQESQGVLSLRWDAQAFPRLSVLHLGSERRVLALGLSGGQASLALDALPAGGRFEFVLAHALDAQRLQAPR